MERIQGRWLWLCVVGLIAVQGVLALVGVHRESLTFDEDDHMFAGYMMWKTADYGLNPEHPPLVKLLATAPLLGEPMWVPPLHPGKEFKTEAYLDGRDWLAHDDGAGQRLVFRMRMSAELLALALMATVFFTTRAWFGDVAGVFALAIAVFDPNILAHSALVTTDVGVSLFFLSSIFLFGRYAAQPSWGRMLAAGVSLGLLLATKHSGILVAPMLFLLAAWEVLTAERGQRVRTLGRMAGGIAVMTVVSVMVLWSFYGFRYAARPRGLQLSTSLAQYAAPLKPFQHAVVMAVAGARLLPESYLMGLVDVKRVAEFYPTFLLGHVFAHGVWWYFPVVIVIKTTLGLLGLLVLTAFAISTGKLRVERAVVYLLVSAAVYLLVAMGSGMNIGARHLLPMYTFLFVLAGAGAAALMRAGGPWVVLCGVLLAAHIVSSLLVYPTEMAYANEVWGGPRNVHNLLSDANVDWAQQLLQVKRWQDRHPAEECWFAYFAYPEVDPAIYGIRCHRLATLDTMYLGGAEMTAPQVHGTVLISAGDLSGCEWASAQLNPYRSFQRKQPDEVIDYGVFVYQGDFDLTDAAAVARAQGSGEALAAKQFEKAVTLAQEAVRLRPENLFAQTALGDAAAAVGNKDLARGSWTAAMAAAQRLEADARPGYVADLQRKLSKL